MNDRPHFPIRDDIIIPPAVLDAWQHLIDLVAEIFHVPAALIMRLHADEIEVFLRSANPEDMFERGELAQLNTGLYCERVMATRRPLTVPNALKDPEWRHNPDVERGMIAYLGFPLIWPTGEIFGTICVLDRKENPFSATYLRAMEQFANLVQHDLALIDADERLRESERRYRALFNSVLDGVFVTQLNGQIVDVNEVAQHALGRSQGEMVDLSFSEVVRASADWHREVLPLVTSKRSFRCEGEEVHWDGRRIPVDLQFVGMTLRNELLVVIVAHDITARKALERELRQLAVTDALTGVGNRAGFEHALTQEIVHADRYLRPLSLAMLDIDHFKRVNDRFGHERGDYVLRHICSVAKPLLREADQFFRYGGEEFMVMMPETGSDGATALAERLRHAIEAEPFGEVGILTVSIGVTEHKAHEPQNAFTSRVDAALYAAKAAGRDRVWRA